MSREAAAYLSDITCGTNNGVSSVQDNMVYSLATVAGLELRGVDGRSILIDGSHTLNHQRTTEDHTDVYICHQ
jgi:hypothetical protein